MNKGNECIFMISVFEPLTLVRVLHVKIENQAKLHPRQKSVVCCPKVSCIVFKHSLYTKENRFALLKSVRSLGLGLLSPLVQSTTVQLRLDRTQCLHVHNAGHYLFNLKLTQFWGDFCFTEL